jgi:hypothetical protein
VSLETLSGVSWALLGSSALTPRRDFEAADYSSQEIVEVMRDTPGELPDSPPVQGGACFLLFGDITCDFGKADNLALVVPDRVDYDIGPKPLAILASPQAFFLKSPVPHGGC